METKSKGLKEQQQHHKKLLAAMLSQDSFDSVHSPAPSIAEEEMEDEDDAMELLGNVTCSVHTHLFYTNCVNMFCCESLLEITEISELPAGVRRLSVCASRCPLLVCEKDTCFLTPSRTQNSLLHLT